jgi:hypothetical protein
MNRTITEGKRFSMILFILLIIWVVTMIASSADVKPGWTATDYIRKITDPGFVFKLCYINATLFTIIVIIYMVILFRFFYGQYPLLSLSAIIFVPIYGLMNLFVYSSQVIILPALVEKISAENLSATEINAISNWIQLLPGSIISMINALAYAILGIPSLLFGWIMIRVNKSGKIAGTLLILNTLVCWAGIIGIVLKNKILSFGVVLGGLLFTVSVFFIFSMFKKINPSFGSNVE